MSGRSKRIIHRSAAVVVACASFFSVLAVPALADSGADVWINWAYEPAGAGIHGRWYNHLTQTGAEVNTSGNYACTNGWYGSKGKWVWGSDSCAPASYVVVEPALAPPGVGAYPWAQSKYIADYLWGKVWWNSG